MQKRSQDTVNGIIDATARVLTARGYAALTTNHVAKEAGVSVGTLYRYFSDKAELVEALRDRTVSAVTATLTESLSLSVKLDPKEGFREVVGTFVAAIEANHAVMRALLSEAPLGVYSNVFPEIERSLGHFARLLLAIVRPDLSQEDGDAMIYVGMAVFATACFRIAIDPPPYLDKARMIDEAAELLAPVFAPRRPSR